MMLIFVPIFYLRVEIHHGDNRPRKNYLTNLICHRNNLETKKTSQLQKCYFYASNSVYFAHLMLLLRFHHYDVFSTQIVSKNVGLYEGLHYFSEWCNGYGLNTLYHSVTIFGVVGCVAYNFLS